MNRDQERKRYTPKKDYQPEVTAANLTEKVNGHLTTLIEAIRTGDTQRLTNYLAFSSRFYRYSQRNQQLIYDQKPEATRVANYRTWQKEGYQVATGQKGIRILVPKFPKGHKLQGVEEAELDAEGDEKQRKAKEVSFVTRNFTVGSVFDVSQLTSSIQDAIPTFSEQREYAFWFPPRKTADMNQKSPKRDSSETYRLS